MAGPVLLYRAKTPHRIHELVEDGWVGIEGARQWCAKLAKGTCTVDLYCLLLDGTELFLESFPGSADHDIGPLMDFHER